MDDSALHGDHDSMSSAIGTKFCQNRLQVRLHGAFGYLEVRADRLVRPPGGHALEHVKLAGCERFVGGVLGDHRCNFRRDTSQAGVYGTYSIEQLSAKRVLQ